MVVFTALVIAGIYAGFTLALRRLGVDARLAFLTAIAAVVIGGDGLSARPHIFSYGGVILLLFVLERQKQTALWAYALVFALWVNLHGGFVYGLALMGAYAAGAILVAGPVSWLQQGRIWGARVGAAVLGTLVNPYGVGLYRQITQTLSDPMVTMATTEFQPPTVRDGPGLLFAASVLLGMALLAASKRRLSAQRLLALLLFGAAAFASGRHVPLFGIVAGAVLALHWSPAFAEPRERYWFGDVIAHTERNTAPGLWLVPIALLACVTAPLNAAIPQEFPRRGYPVQALAAIQSLDLSGRIIHSLPWGGYLMLMRQEHPVFVHPLRYESSALYDYHLVQSASPGWEEVLARWNVRDVLVPSEAPVVTALSRKAEWRLVHRDSTATVFCHRPC